MNTRTTLLILALLISLGSCRNKSICPDAKKGVFKNINDIDGCTWVIELQNGEELEALNISDFAIEVIKDKKIWVTYHKKDAMSVCMVGETVEIECITQRNRD
jgi:hypothetical protein